jgi:hypothetical protein
MGPSSAAASATQQVIGPAVSWTADIGTMPARLIRPTVGFRPTTPHTPAGDTMLPSVSVPTAAGARPAATAAADPELEPDGLRPLPCGFTVWPPSVLQPLVELVDRMLAHSERLALPRITAPAARSPATRKASPDSAPARAGEPAVAGSPPAAMLSLISTGMPSSGRPGAPLARAASLAAASAGACGLTEITACRAGFSRSIRSR